MSYSEITALVTGVLQFALACYVFRLAQLFSVRRSAWIMFSALSILALLGVVLPSLSFVGSVRAQTAIESSYALISLLMLASMVSFVVRFKKHLRAESVVRRAEFDREMETEKQSKERNRVNEQLQQTIARLEAELAESRQAQERAEMISRELQERQSELSRANEELRQSAVRSQIELAEQTQTLMKIREAHQAETGRLVGSLLDNLNAFQQAAIERAKSAKAQGTRSRKVPSQETQTPDEPSRLLSEIDSVRKRLEQIKLTGTVPAPTEPISHPTEVTPASTVSADSCRAETETATQSLETPPPAAAEPPKPAAEPRRRTAKPKRAAARALKTAAAGN
jgi:hypothetical protein